MTQDDDKYTDPALRQRLKEEIQAGDRGGEKGQWSARKAQLLVQEYEKAGGGYTTEDKDDRATHLEQWGEQDWHAKGGGADARAKDGTSRYLPDGAWQLLTKAEREQTDTKKKGGEQQHVANTEAAKEARKAAELLTMNAAEAVRAVHAMEGRSQLRRAKKAEEKHGKARQTVLAAIESSSADAAGACRPTVRDVGPACRRRPSAAGSASQTSCAATHTALDSAPAPSSCRRRQEPAAPPACASQLYRATAPMSGSASAAPPASRRGTAA